MVILKWCSIKVRTKCVEYSVLWMDMHNWNICTLCKTMGETNTSNLIFDLCRNSVAHFSSIAHFVSTYFSVLSLSFLSPPPSFLPFTPFPPASYIIASTYSVFSLSFLFPNFSFFTSVHFVMSFFPLFVPIFYVITLYRLGFMFVSSLSSPGGYSIR